MSFPTIGDDTIRGSEGSELLLGYPDVADGGPESPDDELGRDLIFGLAGNDTIVGGGGADTLSGNAGIDVLIGNSGDDVLGGGDGGDALAGQAGLDLIAGHAGRDTISGGTGDDRLHGGDGNDKLFGGDIAILEAVPGFGGGNDNLYGGAGDDYIYGGFGADILIGGIGNDILRGGQGGDRFVFDGAFGNDRVPDFQPGRDRLDFRGLGLTAASFSYATLDARGDGTADDLLVTVAGLGTITMFYTDATELNAGNVLI